MSLFGVRYATSVQFLCGISIDFHTAGNNQSICENQPSKPSKMFSYGHCLPVPHFKGLDDPRKIEGRRVAGRAGFWGASVH